ncbi:MAG: hypothetical protein U9P50_02660 [Patescibacteria group bacterium]|nr:hypothetical protein [Patescibacteria group bacterium]
MSTLDTQYKEAREGIAKLRDDNYFSWDEREALLLGRLEDDGSGNAKSKVNTQELTNIVFDGASRVMAQFPTGKIFPISKKNTGSAAMMNLVFHKYVVPNANSQFNFLTKLRLWDIYSRVYGSMPALVDYVVTDDYVGPDMWLINPRNFFPQAGAYNIKDMNYCFIDNWVTVDWLVAKLGADAWDSEKIQKVVKDAKDGSQPESRSEDKTYAQTEYEAESSETGKYAKIKLVTRYERDKWTTFAPDFENAILREIPNPHENNKLPIVMKECYPLIDRVYGLAEFERGKTMQYAANSLVNLYLDGIKFSIFPPTISTKNGVVKDSMAFKPGAHWQEIIPNSIRQLQISPQGINTFTETITFLKGSMLNMAATTDTSVSKSTDPGYGKTPEALKQQSSREGARDSWDRHMMEQALQEVYDRFIDMLSVKQEQPIPIMLFGKELEEFQAQYPEEEFTIYDGTGDITVEEEDLKGEFKYVMDAGTTLKKDESIENESLRDLIMLAVRVPGGLEQISQTGKINFGDKQLDFGEAMKRFVVTSGVAEADKIIRDAMPEEQMIGQMQAQKQEMGQQTMSQGVPGQGMAGPSMGSTGNPNASNDQLKQASQMFI